MRRKITVTLTDAEHSGLAAAMAALDAMNEGLDEREYRGESRRDHKNAARAWAKIQEAWYGPAERKGGGNGR